MRRDPLGLLDEARAVATEAVKVAKSNPLVVSVAAQLAREVGKVAEELGFYWYEDPLDEEDMLNYPKLRQQLSIPLMATEYSPGGLYSYAPWLVMQATDYLMLMVLNRELPVLRTISIR